MQHKKTQVAPKRDGRPPLQAARTSFGRTDLKSIVSAAGLLPSEVAPPAHV
jgi:hypothetical protein